MPQFVTATVTQILGERPGLQRVDTDAGRAYALADVIGPVSVGDQVVLNTTAVSLGLGTGGWHVVHWNLARREWSQPGAGHVMKLRYTSVQLDTGAAEEVHQNLPERLDGVPVVVCLLHSQVATVAATARWTRPDARIAYVMTDGAALPLAVSELVSQMCDRGILNTTITAGQAFGGNFEAVSVPSGLVLARHAAQADLLVVGMGPGIVGTSSALGTTAVEAAAILDSAAALGGRAGLCVRASDADGRSRHRGVSHHVSTVLRLVRTHPEVPVPPRLETEIPTGTAVKPPDMAMLLDVMGLRVTSMGRGPGDDPLFFEAAGAAGVWGAQAVPDDPTRAPPHPHAGI